MAKKLMVANGKYQKDGQEKTKWLEVGVILESNGKEFMLIDPIINFAGFDRQGKDRVMVSIFEDQHNNQQKAPQQDHRAYQQPQQQSHQHQMPPQQGEIDLDEESIPF